MPPAVDEIALGEDRAVISGAAAAARDRRANMSQSYKATGKEREEAR
jgi:hypothetical protein